MEDILIYCIKVDRVNYKILDEKFDEIVGKLLENKELNEKPFQLSLEDENGFGYTSLNVVTNHYIDQLFDENPCFAIISGGRSRLKMLKDFIEALLEVYFQSVGYLRNTLHYNSFEIFNSGYDYFRLYLPDEGEFKELYDELYNEGPDYLMGRSISYNKLIVPSFFLFLFEYDGFEKKELNNLADYKIGLA